MLKGLLINASFYVLIVKYKSVNAYLLMYNNIVPASFPLPLFHRVLLDINGGFAWHSRIFTSCCTLLSIYSFCRGFIPLPPVSIGWPSVLFVFVRSSISRYSAVVSWGRQGPCLTIRVVMVPCLLVSFVMKDTAQHIRVIQNLHSLR